MAALPGTSATPSDPIDKQIRPACRRQVPPDAFPLLSLPLLAHLYTIPGTRVLSTTECARLRAIVYESLNEVELRLIVQTLLTKALQGDIQAIKLVLAYAAGKPERGVNPDDLDRLEWEQLRSNAVPPDEVAAVLDSMQPRQASAIAEVMSPIAATRHGQAFLGTLRDRGLLDQPEPRPEPAPAPEPDAAPPPTHGH